MLQTQLIGTVDGIDRDQLRDAQLFVNVGHHRGFWLSCQLPRVSGLNVLHWPMLAEALTGKAIHTDGYGDALLDEGPELVHRAPAFVAVRLLDCLCISVDYIPLQLGVGHYANATEARDVVGMGQEGMGNNMAPIARWIDLISLLDRVQRYLTGYLNSDCSGTSRYGNPTRTSRCESSIATGFSARARGSHKRECRPQQRRVQTFSAQSISVEQRAALNPPATTGCLGWEKGRLPAGASQSARLLSCLPLPRFLRQHRSLLPASGHNASSAIPDSPTDL